MTMEKNIPYGSFPGHATTGRENQAIRAERGRMEVLEMADERKTIRKYLVIGVVIMSVVGLACYDLWMRVEHQFYSNGLTVTGLPKMGKGVPGAGGGILGTLFPLPAKRGPSMHSDRADDETKGGPRMPESAATSQRRLLIRHLMLDPSIMEAQSLLWKQIEDWARAHPREPVHDGMVLILDHDELKYHKLLIQQVYNKLVDAETCDAAHKCTANPIAAVVRSQVCPLQTSAPCPHAIEEEIEASGRWVASKAVDSAFVTLRESVFDKKPLEEAALNGQGQILRPHPNPRALTTHVLPHAGEGVVTQPAAFEKAAESGMGYQPAGALSLNTHTHSYTHTRPNTTKHTQITRTKTDVHTHV
jgi:hypothetical protein